MLRPEYAQAELAKIVVKEWNELLCPSVMALPESLRDIGCALLDREADGLMVNEHPNGKDEFRINYPGA